MAGERASDGRDAVTTTTTGMMSPAYHLNLAVLRRRDPSIARIIDSWTHAVVYEFDGGGWTRKGIEGALFVYER
jgi:hypothetical protein